MPLTATAEAYAARTVTTWAFAVTVAFPSGTERIAEVPLASVTRGPFRGGLRSISDSRVGFGDWRAGLEANELRVEVDDLDGLIRARLDGAGSGALYGSLAYLELASPDLSPGASPGAGDWPLRFVGIYDHAEQSSSAAVVLVLRTDDRQVQKSLNLPILTPSVAPYAVDPVAGSSMPLVYGVHDSRALTGTVAGTTGALPTLFLGTDGATWPYVVTFGPMFHIERVFVGGIYSSPSNWTKVVASRGGLAMTEVRFTSDPGGAVTVDGFGLHPDVSTFAQPPYTTPPAIMRHVLNNFVFGAWRVKAWLSDSSLLDTASWDAAHTYAVRQDQRAGLCIGANDKVRAVDLLQAFAREHGYRLYWTERNKLAIARRDQAETGVYADGSAWIDATRLADPSSVARPRRPAEAADGLRRDVWRLAATENNARSRVTVLAPGSVGLAPEDVTARFAVDCRFPDRNMLAPGGIRLAAAAFAAGGFTGGSGLKDGAAVSAWNGHYNGFNTRYDFNASKANRPALKLGRVNGRAAISFDGSNDYMDASASVASSLASVASNRYQVLIVFRVRSITGNNANPWDNPAIVTDTAGALGISLRNNAGAYTIEPFAIDATGPTLRAPTPQAITLNTWHIARLRNHAGGLSFALDNPLAEVTTTGAALVSTAGVPRLGSNYNGAAFFDGDIAEVHLYNAAPLSGSGDWASPAFGAALEWQVWDTLARDYGIA